MLDELHSGIRELEFLADPTAGEVRVAAPLALSTGFVAEVIDRLHRRYPRVLCNLTTGEAATVFPSLEKREVDLAIAFITNDLPREFIDVQNLFPTEPIVVVASSKNPWTRRRGINLADVMNEPWALMPPQPGPSSADAFRAAGLRPPTPKAIAISIPARLALVARGRFLTITSGPLLGFAGAGLAIKALSIDVPRLGLPSIGIVTLKNRTLTPVAQLFVDCAREVAKPLVSPSEKFGNASKARPRR
jgi:DNA-binding transcriptional LysR family regulator